MENFIRDIADALRGEPTAEQRKKLFEDLWGGGEPDAFSILARSIVQNTHTGIDRTGSYDERSADVHKNIGGSHAGVVVAANLHKYFPNARIIANSYVEKSGERHAEVAARELRDRGISEDQIEVQDESFSTLTEIIKNIQLLVDNHDQNGWKHIVILVNGTQVKRAKAILEKADSMRDPANFRSREGVAQALAKYVELKREGKVKISIISSEDALEKVSRHFARLVAKAKATDIWKRTQEKDDAMALKVLDGTYGRAEGYKPIIQ